MSDFFYPGSRTGPAATPIAIATAVLAFEASPARAKALTLAVTNGTIREAAESVSGTADAETVFQENERILHDRPEGARA